MVEGDLELLILLDPPPECWNSSYAPPHLVLCGAGDRTYDFVFARDATPAAGLLSQLTAPGSFILNG